MKIPCEECPVFAMCYYKETIECESLTNYLYEVDRKVGIYKVKADNLKGVQSLYKKYLFSSAPGINKIELTSYQEIAQMPQEF